jgi:hypothetical protein
VLRIRTSDGWHMPGWSAGCALVTASLLLVAFSLNFGPFGASPLSRMPELDHGKAGIAFLLTMGAGLATSLGAAVVYSRTLVQLANKSFLAGALGFSSGVMLYVSSPGGVEMKCRFSVSASLRSQSAICRLCRLCCYTMSRKSSLHLAPLYSAAIA